MKFSKLTKDELLLIEGGKMSKSSSFAYDLFWGLAWVTRECWDALTSDTYDNSYVNAKVGSY